MDSTGALLLFGLLLIVLAQVGARYVLNSPLAWSESLARVAVFALAAVGAALAQRDHEWVRLDFDQRTHPLVEKLTVAGGSVLLTACALAGVPSVVGVRSSDGLVPAWVPNVLLAVGGIAVLAVLLAARHDD